MPGFRAWTRLAAAVAILLPGCHGTHHGGHDDTRPCPRALTSTPEPCDVSLPPAATPARQYLNLAFQGGGVKGIAHAGAIQVLEQRGVLANVQRVAGTSVGAMYALLLSLGYSAAEILDITMRLDFERFRDGFPPANLLRVFSHYGWHPGTSAKRLFECLIEYKTGSPDTTFRQLEEMRRQDPSRGFRELRAFATNLNTHLWVEFSDREPATRDVRLADALRMSMSYPYLFASQRLDKDVIVDGGFVISYPLDAFDADSRPEQTLGFHLGSGTARTEFSGVRGFTSTVIQTVLNRDNEVLCATPSEVARSVFIDTLDVASFDFSLTAEQKCRLVQSGAAATVQYLDATTHPTTCPSWLIRTPHLGKSPPPS